MEYVCMHVPIYAWCAMIEHLTIIQQNPGWSSEVQMLAGKMGVVGEGKVDRRHLQQAALPQHTGYLTLSSKVGQGKKQVFMKKTYKK